MNLEQSLQVDVMNNADQTRPCRRTDGHRGFCLIYDTVAQDDGQCYTPPQLAEESCDEATRQRVGLTS
jgi:hypothetical protein